MISAGAGSSRAPLVSTMISHQVPGLLQPTEMRLELETTVPLSIPGAQTSRLEGPSGSQVRSVSAMTTRLVRALPPQSRQRSRLGPHGAVGHVHAQDTIHSVYLLHVPFIFIMPARSPVRSQVWGRSALSIRWKGVLLSGDDFCTAATTPVPWQKSWHRLRFLRPNSRKLDATGEIDSSYRRKCFPLHGNREVCLVEVIHRAVTLLRLMAPQPQQDNWGVSELAERSGLSLATVHRLLEALYAEGLVDKNQETRRYRLGFGIMELGLRLVESLEVRRVAYPVMVDLARLTMEAVYLTVRDGTDGVSVERVDSPQLVRMVQPIGVRLPLHMGASRKVILAFLPDEEINRFLLHYPNAATIQEQLAQIRERGYAVSEHEVSDWAYSVAAPVLDHRGQPVAGLCVSGPRERLSAELLPRAVSEATRAAAEVSRLLGYKSGAQAPRQTTR